MGIDITVKIGGEAGQGLQTVGQLLSLTCRDAGLYVFGINDFESRIRGGHNFFQIRISDHPLSAPSHRVNLLVAMDEATRGLHADEVVPDGLILLDSEQKSTEAATLSLPVTAMAKKSGGAIMANTVAAGAVLGLLGAPFNALEDVLKRQFASKDTKVSEQNIGAARLGYDAASQSGFTPSFTWPTAQTEKKMLIEGSLSLALGALAGDCRFAAFYPMSPATSIMMHLSALQDTFPLVVEQAEDEIAAVNMIIGASFAGVRSITSTSGGGFCLMTEGFGYAGIAEVPIVVINAQRPGPATGMATRTAQGDLQFVVRAAQDDFPRFVFAPRTPEEAYTTVAKALDMAEKYQAPAVVLVDQYFNDTLFTVEQRFAVPDSVERYIADESSLFDPGLYRRYEDSPSGISPMALPCRGKPLVMTTGNEHTEDGHVSEDRLVRKKMVDKRARKLHGMRSDMRPPESSNPEAPLQLACWGSSYASVKEAAETLTSSGIDTGCISFCDLWPFPAESASAMIENAEKLIIVEANSTGQFADLLRQETGIEAADLLLKYDGRPFLPNDIAEYVRNTHNK